MKRSKSETARTRKRIVQTAASEFRRNGIHATGVAEVMATAGLTHGGFYRHFGCKDELVSEACAEGMKSLIETVDASATHGGGGKDALRAIVESYLSVKHRDDPSGGCPFVGIGSELARTGPATRKAASNGFLDLVDTVADRVASSDPEAARSRAVFTLCAMVGALTMSRIVDDPDLSTAILEDVKARLLEA